MQILVSSVVRPDRRLQKQHTMQRRGGEWRGGGHGGRLIAPPGDLIMTNNGGMQQMRPLVPHCVHLPVDIRSRRAAALSAGRLLRCTGSGGARARVCHGAPRGGAPVPWGDAHVVITRRGL